MFPPVRPVLDDPQAHAIGAFAPVEHPQIPGCRVVNSPIEFGGVEPRAHRGAPELGQHTEEVALEAGLSTPSYRGTATEEMTCRLRRTHHDMT